MKQKLTIKKLKEMRDDLMLTAGCNGKDQDDLVVYSDGVLDFFNAMKALLED